MDKVEQEFESLVQSLAAIGPGRSTPSASEVLSGLSEHHHKFLEHYVALRNPGATFQHMDGTVDGILITSHKKAGRVGLTPYLTDYDEVSLLPGTKFYTDSSKFDTGEVLHSYFIPTLSEDNQKLAYGRLSEGKSGSPVRLYNLVPMVLLALGKARFSPESRVCMGMLKTFSKLWGEKGDDECDDPPYGNIRVTVDTMSPKKLYTTVNMMYLLNHFSNDVMPYLRTRGIDTELMIREYLSIMCASPIGHTLALKGALGFAYMHGSAMSGSGTHIVVPNSDEWNTYQKFDSPKVSTNAGFWNELYGQTYRGYIKELREMGHSQLSKIVALSVTIPHGSMSIRFGELISGIRAVGGYVGTNQNVTFADIFDPKKDSTLYKGEGFPESYARRADGSYVMPSVPFLREIMKTSYTDMLNADSRIRMLTWEDFVKVIPRYLTSNSAGIGNVKLIGKLDGEPLEIKTTAKSMIYPLSPLTFRPKPGDVITMSNVETLYPPFTEDNPGRMAARRVVAKPTRAVQMQPLAPYILEAYMFGPLYRLYMKKPDPFKYVFPGSTVIPGVDGMRIDTACMTLGTETGNPFIDHRDAFCDTGSACLRGEDDMVLLYAGDYSAYDETETSRNVRVPFRDGILDAFESKGAIGPFSGADVIMKVLAPCIPAAYKLPNGDVVYLDGVRSGEYATMLINNSQNASVCGAVIQRVHNLDAGRFTDIKVQGDDVRGRVEMPPRIQTPKFGLSDKDSAMASECVGLHNVTSFAKIATHEICECGQETNEQKGIMSTNIYDYLKIRVCAGRLSPNNYAQLFGSENVGMSDSPQSFMSGQLQKGDLVVSRGADPEVVFRFGLMLFLLRCSYRVGIRGSNPDHSHMYYPPISMWFTPTSMGGLGRAPFPFPFPGDPALSIWLHRDQEVLAYVNARAGSLRARANKDYAKIIAGLIMGAATRSDFKVASNTSPQTIPMSDLLRPFSKGVAEMSSSLDVSAISRSEVAYGYLRSRGSKLVPAKMLYKNSPARQIENVISSNANVMEFSYNKAKFISTDSFVGGKALTFSDSERWINSMIMSISDAEPVAPDYEGPLCFVHPKLIGNLSAVGWGSTSRDTQKGIASVVNAIKTDPLFPRDITDEGIMRLLFSPEVSEDPNVLPNVLLSLGCTEDTVSRVVSMFGDTAVNTILLQYMSGSFSLNTPMFQMLDRSQASIRRYIVDVAESKESKTALPAIFAFWNFMTHARGRPVAIKYETTPESAKLTTQVEPLNIIPFTPILEAERMRSENRAPVNSPYH